MSIPVSVLRPKWIFPTSGAQGSFFVCLFVASAKPCPRHSGSWFSYQRWNPHPCSGSTQKLPFNCEKIVRGFLKLKATPTVVQFSSVAQSCPTLCDPMDCSTSSFPVLHYLPEFARPHIHGTLMLSISSSATPFSSRLQSFPASGPFPESQLYTSGCQSIGASASVLPMNIQDCFPLG